MSATDLISLALAVERLTPSHRDPHAFHEAKSEIAHKLRLLAKGIPPSKNEELSLSRPVRTTHFHLVAVSKKIASPKRGFHGR